MGLFTKNWKDVLIHKCIRISIQFNQLSIKHPLFFTYAIWIPVMLGTLLNTVMLTTDQISSFKQIQQIWFKIIRFLELENSLTNILIMAIILSLCGLVVYWLVKPNNSYRPLGLYLGLFIVPLSSVLVRYCFTLVLAQNVANLGFLVTLLGLLSILCLLAIDLLFNGINLSYRQRTQNLLSRKFSNQLLLKSLVTTYIFTPLSVAYCQYMQTSVVNVLVLLGHLLQAFIPLYVFLTSYIYLCDMVNRIYLLASCFEFSFVFIAFISQVTQNSLFSANLELLAIFGTFWLFWASIQYNGNRKNEIIIQMKSSGQEIGCYLHYLGSQLVQTNTEGNNLQLIFNTLKNHHKSSCNLSSCQCRIENKSDDRRLLEQFLIKKKVQKIMEDNKDNFQIMIQCCHMMLEFFHAFPDLLYLLKNVGSKMKKLSFFQEFQFLYFQVCLEDFLEERKRQPNAIQTQKIQIQDQLIIKMINTMHKVATCKFQLWLTLNKRNPDQQILQKQIKKENQKMQEIQELRKQIMRKYSSSIVLLQLINLYDICLKLKTSMNNQLKQTIQCRQIAKKEEAKMLKHQKFNLEQIMFGKSCVLFESAIEKDNMGLIVNTSKNIFDVFGYKREAIIGQNINEIMPKSMQKEHDLLLDSWRERASWANVQKVRNIFAMTKDRICFSTSIYLRILIKEESVNIVGAFLKGNQNDYMIVNEDGTIEGVGFSFKNTLGDQIARLPLSFICDSADSLIQEIKIFKSRKQAAFKFYHTKGLEKDIVSRRIIMNQITSSQGLEIETQIKNRSRAVKILISYEPYHMGSKSFILIKFLSTQKMHTFDSIQKQRSSYPVQPSTISQQCTNHANSSIPIIEDPPQQNLHLNFCDENSSIHTSNYGLGTSSSNLFSYLQEKQHTTSIFSNKAIAGNFKMFAIVAVTVFSMLFAQFFSQLYMCRRISLYSLQVAQFYFKANSLILAYSRLSNLQSGLSNSPFQLQRAEIQINRVKKTMQFDSSQLWSQNLNWGQPPILDRLVNYNDSRMNVKKLAYEQIYSYYIQLLEKQKQGQTDPRQKTLINKIQINQDNLQNNFCDNIAELSSNIAYDIWMRAVLARVIIVWCFIFVFVHSLFLINVGRISRKHSNQIFQVFLSISDRNCEGCLTYFRKILGIFDRINNRTDSKSPRSIQTYFLQDTPFMQPLESFSVQMDKFYRKKQSIKQQASISKFIKILIFSVALVVIALLGWHQKVHYTYRNQESLFFMAYTSMVEMDMNLIYDFVMIKSLMLKNYLSDEDRKYLNHFNMHVQKQGLSMFTDSLYNVTSTTLKIDPTFQVSNSTLCESIKQSDPHFYQNICNNFSFPFQNFKIFQVHSYILYSLQEIIVSIESNTSSSEQKEREKIMLIEQAVNLNYIYFRQIMNSLPKAGSNHFLELEKISTLWNVGLFVLIVAIVGMAGYEGHFLCIKMSKECALVLVIPEIVLRNTKGAMKLIENLLKNII